MSTESEGNVAVVLHRLRTWSDEDYLASPEARWSDVGIIARALSMPRCGMPHWVQDELNKATRQFRHNDDNSPDLGEPGQGFVIAYDREIIEELILRILYEANAMMAKHAPLATNTPEGYALIRQDVVDFLRGISSLNGQGFSERKEQEVGTYWWRSFLPPPSPSGA